MGSDPALHPKVVPQGFLYWQPSTGVFILDHLKGNKCTGKEGIHIYIHVTRNVPVPGLHSPSPGILYLAQETSPLLLKMRYPAPSPCYREEAVLNSTLKHTTVPTSQSVMLELSTCDRDILSQVRRSLPSTVVNLGPGESRPM